MYGLTLTDCNHLVAPTESKTNPGRTSVHLSGVRKVRLGTVYLPAQYTEVETVTDRDKAMKAIDALTPEEMEPLMDPVTRANVREFVSDGREVETPATSPVTTPSAEELRSAPEQVPTGDVLAGEQTEHAGVVEQLVVEHAETVEEHLVVTEPPPIADQVPTEQLPEEVSITAGAGSAEGGR